MTLLGSLRSVGVEEAQQRVARSRSSAVLFPLRGFSVSIQNLLFAPQQKGVRHAESMYTWQREGGLQVDTNSVH
jgi:hypothetical protein